MLLNSSNAVVQELTIQVEFSKFALVKNQIYRQKSIDHSKNQIFDTDSPSMG